MITTRPIKKTSEVFVAGGQPTVTFNPREPLKLTRKVQEYLDTLYKILSVSGPTKSGKTVLVRSVLPPSKSLWIAGGAIKTIDDFWDFVVDRLQAFNSTTVTIGDTRASGGHVEGEASLKVGGTGGSVKSQYGSSSGSGSTLTHTRNLSGGVVGARVLAERKTPVVIDDFHYVPQDTQMDIIRGLKDAVFEGLPLILLSVPHRAFDAVRVEREMTGRVTQLPVPDWSAPDLREIALKGFEALNVNASDESIDRLVKESFSSPHLMQDFCGQICRDNGVLETQISRSDIQVPGSWDQFFQDRASDASKMAFDRLATGPRKRTERKGRKMRDGTESDIYVAVLRAIAATGPATQITYDKLRAAMKEVMQEPPQINEVVRVLDKMGEIARTMPGEPVVDYDKDMSTLHISDPFFAYYLRWGVKFGDDPGTTHSKQ